MENLEITPVTVENAPALASLAREIWTEHFTPIIGGAQVEYMLKRFQSAPALTEQMRSGYRYYFFVLNGRTAGYTGIKKDGSSLFLSKIYVKKEFRGKKIAKAGIDFMKGICLKETLKSIWLTVNKYNGSAIAAYNAMGFKNIRAQVTDIGGGFVMDDYVMELKI